MGFCCLFAVAFAVAFAFIAAQFRRLLCCIQLSRFSSLADCLGFLFRLGELKEVYAKNNCPRRR